MMYRGRRNVKMARIGRVAYVVRQIDLSATNAILSRSGAVFEVNRECDALSVFYGIL